jgi:hypothetical protein
MRRRVVIALVAVLVVAGVAVLYAVGPVGRTPAGCTVTMGAGDDLTAFPMTVEQTDNAATIAGVGRKLGMPDHAVSVALATAMQESGLRNLRYGDRDSLGLFQQRPSQGWGRPDQLNDPVYAATAFYQRLRQQPNWHTLEVTDAAQLVQRSALPSAYAQWEPQARAMAAALTGEAEASLSCHDLEPVPAAANVVTVANRELGTAALSGPQPPERGRALAHWLVAHASRLGLGQVGYDGRTWTAESGEWQPTGAPDGRLSLRLAPPPA